MEAEKMEYEMEQLAQSAVIDVEDGEVPQEDRYNHLITATYRYKEVAVSPVTLPTTVATTSGNFTDMLIFSKSEISINR
ncbi:unnamed protein product [Onchocerca flexuosa]|uniref:Ovule protein n=1 Tax=Onchocerca flexuosa TaxID=387005 RepID=A0A183I8D5_9BILA|nr:unnamed protein product [Onchocerca flexuosa]